MDRGLLADATSVDDSPTPGYMLNEIARATTANYQVNVQIQDYLVSRVQHKHHNVKYKALVVIKHVCRSGRPEFKREMHRKVDPIKECLQFKGNPDPLRGDEPNRRVREAAREALDAIFDSQMPVTTSAVAAANRIQGMGNDWVPPEQAAAAKTGSGSMLSSIVNTVSSAVLGDATEITYTGHPGATGSFNGYANRSAPTSSTEYNPSAGGGYSSSSVSSASSMSGFGNPNFRDARQDKTWMQKASEYYTTKTAATPPPPVTFATPVGSDYNFASNRGPNALANQEQAWQPAMPGTVVPDLPQGPLGMGRAGSAASDGGYERNLVESLCEPGGLKPVPNEAKLADFLNSAPSLSAELVGNSLLDTLNSDAWQSRTKALMVIAQLLQANNVQTHVDFWAQNVDQIHALLQDSKAAVRTQASKALKLITGEGAATEDSSLSTKSSSAAASTSTKTKSFLDIFDSPAAASPVSVPAPVPVPSNAMPVSDNASSLFAGLSIGGSAEQSAAPAAAAAYVAPTDLFSGLNVPTTPVNAPVPAPVITSASAISELDLLSELSSSPFPAPVVAAAAPMDIFGNMTLHSAPLSSSFPASPVPPAFDFMDSLSTAPPAPPASTASTGFSFINSAPLSAMGAATSGLAISSSFSTSAAPPAAGISPFNELTAAYMTPSSSHNSAKNAPMAMPYPQTNGFPQYAQQAPYVSHEQHHPQYAPAPVGGYVATQPYQSVPMGSSVLAPGMLSVTAARKTIPDAASGANSGFSFLGGSPVKTPNGGGHDSFSFVTDAMKDMSK